VIRVTAPSSLPPCPHPLRPQADAPRPSLGGTPPTDGRCAAHSPGTGENHLAWGEPVVRLRGGKGPLAPCATGPKCLAGGERGPLAASIEGAESGGEESPSLPPLPGAPGRTSIHVRPNNLRRRSAERVTRLLELALLWPLYLGGAL